MSVQTGRCILRGSSDARDPRDAARELAAAIGQKDATRFLFASPRFDGVALSQALHEAFDGDPFLGCTTAGEIDERGYCEGSLVGLSIPNEDVSFEVFEIPELRSSLSSKIQEVARRVRARIREVQEQDPRQQPFLVLLVDGLTMQEERVVGQLHACLPELPLVGGSAGDGLVFGSTAMLRNGRALEDAALVCLGMTALPFHAFKMQHLRRGADKLVVTKADIDARLVLEIDGRPAVESYAQMLGLAVEDLGSDVFSRHPLLLRMGGEDFVRSIQQANSDGSLSFYCAIDEGLVLTAGRGDPFVDSLREGLRELHERIAEPQLILGFECILRRLEAIESGQVAEVSRLMVEHGVFGFHTYGEQFGGVHVNQTFTGLVLGRQSESGDAE